MTSIDAALSAIPVLVDEIRALRREVGELRGLVATKGDTWVSPSQWARAKGLSIDTAYRRIASGDVEVQELGRTALVDKDGAPLLDKHGQPRFRRTLRVRLARPVGAAEVRRIAAEMTSPS